MEKKTMKILAYFVIVFALGFINFQSQTNFAIADEVSFLPPESATVPQGGIGTYVSGGRNVEAYRYVHSEGFPMFLDKTKFIGTLSGNWYQMGVEFGARSGDMTRCVSDIWWSQECEMWGKAKTLKAMDLYEAQIAALDPHQIEFMKGLAEGASPWLDQSEYADQDHPLYATNYQRVLAVNIWDEWSMIHPSKFPDGSSTFGGTETAPPVTGLAGCSAFAARGGATVGGKVISAQNRHTPYDPRVYQQAYIINPPQGGNVAWVLTNSPQVAANQVVNDKGVSISLLFGGVSNPKSWEYEGGPYFAEAFGVPWFNLFLYVGTHANTAEEAIEMLTLGTPEYRRKTGRNTLLVGGGWIFLVADEHTLAIVEKTANRYAIRYPGEFTGPDFTSPDYIVSTNHFLCDFSYDKDNKLTTVPLGIFNVVPLSEDRFWTLMWDMKHRYGRIDKYMAQHIMSGLYGHDQETGELKECVEGDGECGVYGRVKACNQGTGVSLVTGSNDCKVAMLEGEKSEISWTLGNGSDWEGAWDEYYFKYLGTQSKSKKLPPFTSVR